jgi:hypothetical protein
MSIMLTAIRLHTLVVATRQCALLTTQVIAGATVAVALMVRLLAAEASAVDSVFELAWHVACVCCRCTKVSAAMPCFLIAQVHMHWFSVLCILLAEVALSVALMICLA